MTKLLRTSLLAASVATLAVTSHAQVITTTTGFDPTTAYNSADGFSSASSTLTQTFSGVTAIDSVTFRFMANDSLPAYSGPALDYTFQTWNTSTNRADTQISSGTFTLAPYGSWNLQDGFRYIDNEITLSQTGLSSNLTYGLTIFGDGNTALSVRIGAGSTAYANGDSFAQSAETFGDLQTQTSTLLGSDLAFSANATLAPVPESSTAAVLFAGLFVGGLMFRRRRHVGSLQAQA